MTYEELLEAYEKKVPVFILEGQTLVSVLLSRVSDKDQRGRASAWGYFEHGRHKCASKGTDIFKTESDALSRLIENLEKNLQHHVSLCHTFQKGIQEYKTRLEVLATEKKLVCWEETSPGEWIFETEFGCLRVDDGKDYRSEGDAAFLAYWGWEDTFEIGYFDTVDEAKRACMKDLERRIKPLAEALGLVWVAEPTEDEEPCFCMEEGEGDYLCEQSEESADAKTLDACGKIAQGNTDGLEPPYFDKILQEVCDRLLQEAARRDPGYFYCHGPEAEKCLWRKEGVHLCAAPEGYNCLADFIDGIRTKNSTTPLCPECDGAGWVRCDDLGYGDSSKTCPKCHGKRVMQVKTPTICLKCGGDGYIRLAGYGDDSRTCEVCGGSGVVTK